MTSVDERSGSPSVYESEKEGIQLYNSNFPSRNHCFSGSTHILHCETFSQKRDIDIRVLDPLGFYASV